MPDLHENTGTAPLDLTKAARAQAPWAGIAAVAMLYFGFWHLFDDAFAAQLIGYTLKAGGIAMAASAVLLLTGLPVALLFDGVVAALIGVALALGGLLWFAAIRPVDFSGILYVAFGYVFFNSGRRGLSDYLRVNPLFIDTPPAGAAGEPYESSSGFSSAASVAPASVTPEPPPAPDELADAPEGYLSSFADDKRDPSQP